MAISRRNLLISGGLTAGAIAAGGAWSVSTPHTGVPGADRIRKFLGACGDDPGVPGDEPGELLGDRWESAAGSTLVNWRISYPPGTGEGSTLPVCLVLHGAGGSAEHAFEINHALDRYQAAAKSPFALASVDGGETFWHRRANGDDPIAMLIDEFLPMLHDRGLLTDRILVHGWGTGGFGSLLLLRELGWKRIVAMALLAPALYERFGDAIPGAFDNAADFEANDPFSLVELASGGPMRIDCGADDPFAPAVERFRSQIHPTPEGELSPGCRDMAYWHSVRPDIFSFLNRAAAAEWRS